MEQKNVDRNLIIETDVDVSDLTLYDVREEPFRVYGLYDYKNEPEFKRMPDGAARAVSENVAILAKMPAGGRVRFSTNSKHIAIRALMPSVGHFSNMPITGSAGFDLFVEEPTFRLYRHAKTFVPPYDIKNGYVSRFEFPDKRLRYITINFPCYNPLTSLEIGLDKDAEVGEGLDYRSDAPIVYYGSSITQGGSASRPGNTYQNIVTRALELDHVNLGFSGNAKGEDEIVDYIKSLKMYAFVCDYDHNATIIRDLERTHLRMYQRIREAHPDVPYIIISKVDFDQAYVDKIENNTPPDTYNSSITRRNIIMDTYRYARDHGDRNVYFIDGESVFRGYSDMTTVDTVHPGDLGFMLMAKAVTETIKRAITQKYISE